MRPKQEKADIEALRAFWEAYERDREVQFIISAVMKGCGCTYQEIGDVFKVSRQRAERLTKPY